MAVGKKEKDSVFKTSAGDLISLFLKFSEMRKFSLRTIKHWGKIKSILERKGLGQVQERSGFFLAFEKHLQPIISKGGFLYGVEGQEGRKKNIPSLGPHLKDQLVPVL